MGKTEIYIKVSRDFLKVIKTGRKIHSIYFILYTTYAEENNAASKLGITISSKEIPLANKRNRIRRMIKEHWRKVNKKVHNRLVVLIIKKSVLTLKNESFYSEVINIFNKIIS